MKSEYKAELAYLVQAFINDTCQQKWYDDIADVAAFNVIGGKWQKEAENILLWSSLIWETVELHLAEGEETEPHKFIETLPALEL